MPTVSILPGLGGVIKKGAPALSNYKRALAEGATSSEWTEVAAQLYDRASKLLVELRRTKSAAIANERQRLIALADDAVARSKVLKPPRR